MLITSALGFLLEQWAQSTRPDVSGCGASRHRMEPGLYAQRFRVRRRFGFGGGRWGRGRECARFEARGSRPLSGRTSVSARLDVPSGACLLSAWCTGILVALVHRARFQNLTARTRRRTLRVCPNRLRGSELTGSSTEQAFCTDWPR